MQTEVEETLKRIESRKGVIGTIVVNAEGKMKLVTIKFHQDPFIHCVGYFRRITDGILSVLFKELYMNQVLCVIVRFLSRLL